MKDGKVFMPTASPALGLLNALGKSRVGFIYVLAGMAIIWSLGAPLIVLYGAIGFAIANIFEQSSHIWLYRVAQRQVPFRILRVITPVWSIASMSGLFIYILCRICPPSHIINVVIYGVCGLLIDGVGMIILYSNKIRSIWISLIR